MNIPRFASLTALVVALSACSASTPSTPVTPEGAASGAAVAPATSVDTWNDTLAQKGLPSAGCFIARYPSTAWSRTPCATPPRLWFPRSHARRNGIGPADVGDGQDYTADTAPRRISKAIGKFPIAEGVETVTSEGCCGYQGLNSYSLQLNSQFFPTSACGSLPNCLGWEQFVYSNPPGTSEGALFIQDWLVATKGSFSKCPPSQGWQNVGIGCVQNSPYGAYVPNVPITDIKKVVETGAAASSGDSVYLAVDGTAYGMKNVQSDGITDLAKHWQGAEFNIIGNGGGDVADFSGTPEITVSIQTDTGRAKAPKCPANSGTTGETNNLSFVTAPKHPAEHKYPSVEFTMSGKSGGPASCDSVPAT